MPQHGKSEKLYDYQAFRFTASLSALRGHILSEGK